MWGRTVVWFPQDTPFWRDRVLSCDRDDKFYLFLCESWEHNLLHFQPLSLIWVLEANRRFGMYLFMAWTPSLKIKITYGHSYDLVNVLEVYIVYIEVVVQNVFRSWKSLSHQVFQRVFLFFLVCGVLVVGTMLLGVGYAQLFFLLMLLLHICAVCNFFFLWPSVWSRLVEACWLCPTKPVCS